MQFSQGLAGPNRYQKLRIEKGIRVNIRVLLKYMATQAFLLTFRNRPTINVLIANLNKSGEFCNGENLIKLRRAVFGGSVDIWSP